MLGEISNDDHFVENEHFDKFQVAPSCQQQLTLYNESTLKSENPFLQNNIQTIKTTEMNDFPNIKGKYFNQQQFQSKKNDNQANDIKQNMVKQLIPKVVQILAEFATNILELNQTFMGFNTLNQSFDVISMNLKDSLQHAILINEQPLAQYLSKKTSQQKIFNLHGIESKHMLNEFSISDSSSEHSLKKMHANSFDSQEDQKSQQSSSSFENHSTLSKTSNSNLTQTSIKSFVKSNNSNNQKKELKDKPKSKIFQIKKQLNNKFEWNNKYAFPKDSALEDSTKIQPFSKIDLLNKNLEKKIIDKNLENSFLSTFDINIKSVNKEDINFQNKMKLIKPLPQILAPLKELFNPFPSSSIFDSLEQFNFEKSKTSAFNNHSNFSSLSKLSSLNQSSLNFLDTLKSITSNWKENYKQVSLKSFQQKTENAPPPADLFANLPSTTNFQIGTPLFQNINNPLNFQKISNTVKQ
eukprot:403356619